MKKKKTTKQKQHKANSSNLDVRRANIYENVM